MARIYTIDRGETSAQEISFGIPKIGTKISGHGWKITMDDNVMYDAVLTNPGPQPARVILCEPTGLLEQGPWDVFAYIEQLWSWKPPDNELFVFAQLKDSSGKWNVVDASQGHSDPELLNEGSQSSGVRITWTTQNLSFKIAAR